MAHDVFISHSSKDKPIADAVCAALEARGIRCWVAPRDIVPGKDWGESVVAAIKGAKVMVLVFSTNANNSPQIKREVERAANQQIPIIPLRIEEVLPTASLEYFLSTPHWLDAFTPPLESHLLHLAQVIRQIIGETPAQTAAVSSPSAGVLAPARTGGGNAKAVQPARSQRAWLAAAAALVGLLGLGGWYFAAHRSEQRRQAAEAARAEQARIEAQRKEAEHLANARGGLVVTTTPPGAEVAVGGSALDKSPLTLKDVKLGRYSVVMRLAGYEDERREVEVKENEFATLDVALVRSAGAAQIASSPPGLAFELSGEGKTERGITPAKVEQLPPGSYTLTVSRAGWPDQQQMVKVLRNQTVPAVVEFVGGSLEIKSEPPGLAFELSGQERAERGTTPAKIEQLPTGDYTLTVSREGWPDQKQAVTVRRNQTLPALAEFPGGALEITSTPPGAEVYSHGKGLGTTPLSLQDLIPSSLELEFRLAGYLNATRPALVRARETAHVAATLEKIPAQPETETAVEAAYSLNQLDLAPVPIYQVAPQYPFEMREKGVTGVVVVAFIVDADGTVGNVHVMNSTRHEFDAAAVEAVSQWRFRPGQKQGHKARAQMKIPITFSLDE